MCPARTKTPPRCAHKGKRCPGVTRSEGFDLLSISTLAELYIEDIVNDNIFLEKELNIEIKNSVQEKITSSLVDDISKFCKESYAIEIYEIIDLTIIKYELYVFYKVYFSMFDLYVFYNKFNNLSMNKC